jgi:hypothetical protein
VGGRTARRPPVGVEEEGAGVEVTGEEGGGEEDDSLDGPQMG